MPFKLTHHNHLNSSAADKTQQTCNSFSHTLYRLIDVWPCLRAIKEQLKQQNNPWRYLFWAALLRLPRWRVCVHSRKWTKQCENVLKKRENVLKKHESFEKNLKTFWMKPEKFFRLVWSPSLPSLLWWYMPLTTNTGKQGRSSSQDHVTVDHVTERMSALLHVYPYGLSQRCVLVCALLF